MTSFLLQDFSFSSMLFGSLQTSYGGCINPPVRSIQENVRTAPFNERNVPLGNTMTGSVNLCSSVEGRFKEMINTIPRLVPTNKQGEIVESFFRAKDSMKYSAVIASLESLSILEMLELLERL